MLAKQVLTKITLVAEERSLPLQLATLFRIFVHQGLDILPSQLVMVLRHTKVLDRERAHWATEKMRNPMNIFERIAHLALEK